MNSAASLLRAVLNSCVSSSLLTISVALLAAFATGCGTNMSSIPPTPQNTSMTVMVSSTANDQLSQMNVTITSLTLTNTSGKTVSVFTTPQPAEFIHLNGAAEPLLTVSVPQDTYTAASATVQSAPQVTCVMAQPNNGLSTDEFQSGTAPVVTLSLPAPIRVTGTAMGLLLNLQVSQSVMPANCPLTPANPTINTAFIVTPVTLASPPTNLQNGKMSSLVGQISAVNAMANSFTVAAPDGPTWAVASDSNTIYQGVAAFSTLAAGMPVEMDLAIQSDGSLLATRVSVPDANPTNLTDVDGPVMQVTASVPALFTFGREVQGFLFMGEHFFGTVPFSFNNSVTQISPRLTNLQSLPFAPVFTTANMVPGQNVSFSAHALTQQGGPTYIPATTLTLMPQTIDGVVTASGSEGNFTTYTISLAPYDLLPNLAVQPGQTTLLTDPNTVVVYVDSSAQLLNTKQLAVGSVFRFNGLLFNDNGTLRMDVAQVNDGVPQ
jgi:Domain of unknown function (DUF5666)